MSNETVRLDSLLSQKGYCARRKVQNFLRLHRVTVDGELINQGGYRVGRNALVLIDGRKLCTNNPKIYIALHKPEGYLCSMADVYGRKLAADLIPESKTQRIYHVGRLDYDSCGLVLFTNDGDWANRLTHPKYGIEKEYEVWTEQPVSKKMLSLMCRGILDENEHLRIERYKFTQNSTCVRLILKEGKNREIRRLFAHFELRIKSLKRMRIGSIFLGKLGSGERRILKEEEVESFRKKC